jgi:hypothetical protein
MERENKGIKENVLYGNGWPYIYIYIGVLLSCDLEVVRWITTRFEIGVDFITI